MSIKIDMNRSWKFHDGDIETAAGRSHAEAYGSTKAGNTAFARIDWDDSGWDVVNLPHDWVVGREFDTSAMLVQGYKHRGIGIYRKSFILDDSYKNHQLLLEFGGVSTFCTVYVNGSVMERNWDGYNNFTVDITDRVFFEDVPNTIAVHVDARSFQGWWYEGGGIYREVWLHKKPMLHFAQDGIYVNPSIVEGKVWRTDIAFEVENSLNLSANFRLVYRILDKEGNPVGEGQARGNSSGFSSSIINSYIMVDAPKVWDIDSPNMYTLTAELYVDGICEDSESVRFGFRTIAIFPDTGFYLNGRPLKIKGTCNHQDHAGVGVALSKSLITYRIRRLKEMGNNAYRTAHGNSGLVKEVCDELGMLVMEENRVFESTPECLARLDQMVKTSRNHPSVVMYCIFNEEDLQGTSVGRRMALRMINRIKQMDSGRPVTAAMNGGHLAAEGVADILDIAGFNYSMQSFDAYREKYPGQPMIGTENNCAFSTRGIYKTSTDKHYYASYDDEKAYWGNYARETWEAINSRQYMMGYFIWTGFDYRGEPTPHEWPSINSHWGIMDTCGFSKDSFWLHRAFWTDEPMVHIVPSHWNFGQTDLDDNGCIRVMAHTNCDECELFLNGVSLGRKPVSLYEQADWLVEYKPGVLEMLAYRFGEEAAIDFIKTAGKPVKLVMEPQGGELNSTARNILLADSRDSIPVNVHAVDSEGNFVPFADNLISFTVSGGISILGVGNGNPTSHEPDQSDKRKLWNGRCQVIIGRAGADCAGTRTTITAFSDELDSAVAELDIVEAPFTKEIPSLENRYINKWSMTAQPSAVHPDPNKRSDSSDMNTWERVELGFGPQNVFSALNDAGECGGYVLYRTNFRVNDTDEHILRFNGIVGNPVDIYVNGEAVVTGLDKTWGRGTDVTVKADNDGNISVAVCIYSVTRGGLTNTVMLL